MTDPISPQTSKREGFIAVFVIAAMIVLAVLIVWWMLPPSHSKNFAETLAKYTDRKVAIATVTQDQGVVGILIEVDESKVVIQGPGANHHTVLPLDKIVKITVLSAD